MRSGTDRAAAVAAYVLVALLGVGVGLVGSFQQAATARLAGVTLPVGLVLALAASIAVFIAAGLATRSRTGAGLAFVGWLLSTVVLSLRRPEGDLVVPATVHGLVWLFGGTLLGALCVAWPYGVSVGAARREARTARRRASGGDSVQASGGPRPGR